MSVAFLDLANQSVASGTFSQILTRLGFPVDIYTANGGPQSMYQYYARHLNTFNTVKLPGKKPTDDVLAEYELLFVVANDANIYKTLTEKFEDKTVCIFLTEEMSKEVKAKYHIGFTPLYGEGRHQMDGCASAFILPTSIVDGEVYQTLDNVASVPIFGDLDQFDFDSFKKIVEAHPDATFQVFSNSTDVTEKIPDSSNIFHLINPNGTQLINLLRRSKFVLTLDKIGSKYLDAVFNPAITLALQHQIPLISSSDMLKTYNLSDQLGYRWGESSTNMFNMFSVAMATNSAKHKQLQTHMRENNEEICSRNTFIIQQLLKLINKHRFEAKQSKGKEPAE